MRDYIRRILIAFIMAFFVSLLFLGIKHPEASVDVTEMTSHWIWPSGGVVSDTFGSRNGQHKGIDIAGPAGTSVYAVDSGIVTKSYYSDTYGNVIFIKHNNGIETVYAHLEERQVQEGDNIHQGELIGKMGNTGHSSGVHLHFEVHLSEWTYDKINAINPMIALDKVRIGQEVTAIVNNKNKR